MEKLFSIADEGLIGSKCKASELVAGVLYLPQASSEVLADCGLPMACVSQDR